MHLRLPIRFRTRALLAITLLGLCLLVSLYFSPISENYYQVSIDRSETFTRSWWRNIFSWTLSQENSGCKNTNSRTISRSFLDTSEMYPKLDFSVPDNGNMGYWNKALENRYRETRKSWKELPLEVIVVPHSHVDPGWLRTYEDYFDNYVVHILNNMVTFLDQTDDFKFIWSEISYFSKWWNSQKEDTRKTLKKLLDKKKLEFVTGGWVMSDEATTSYFAIIDQLVEGHQWLKHHIGVSPEFAWSVDIFGHSATMPHILSSSGISGLIILRIHYAWKAFLAKMRWFDFYWEQHFTDSSRILTHMAPSDLYSFKHVCGPDRFVCLKYDFRSVMGEYSESTADKITDRNVELKAGYLLAQYGRFASLFPHNIILVPLGDDFRYNIYNEWTQQHTNFQKLMRYINEKKEWNARIRFGTVADYFNEVNKRLKNQSLNALPTLKGDFLPYADIYANNRPSYWNGFYTTRPFYKKLAQELESWLRTSEILYSFATATAENSVLKKLISDYELLISARQKLGLFQHHDAITGTSKGFVMRDYGQKLHTGINDAMSVTAHVAQLFLMENTPEGQTWTSQVYPDIYRPGSNEASKKLSIFVPDNGRKVIVFNPLTIERTEVVRFKVRTAKVKVMDSSKNIILSQINPVWTNDLTMSNILFELAFVVKVKPLSFSIYTIAKESDEHLDESTKAIISLFLNDDPMTTVDSSAFKFEKPIGKDIVMESETIRATFSKAGGLKNVYLKQSGISKSIKTDIFAYEPLAYRSGAYLFNPSLSPPVLVSNLTDHFPILCLIRGPLMSELNIIYQDVLTFSVRLYNFENAPEGLEMNVVSDISKIKDSELILRISSDVKHNKTFYTDSNGFQMIKRKHASNLPIQANYYPATSAMYIEDNNDQFRLNLLLPHSHAVTSVSGDMDVMIDRRMRDDDGRGVGEGIQDNQKISTSFWLLPETTSQPDRANSELTLRTQVISQQQKYPVVTLLIENPEAKLTKEEFSFLTRPWPSEVHLVNLRTIPSHKNYSLPSNDSLMILHTHNVGCRTSTFVNDIIENRRILSFSFAEAKQMNKVSLTGVTPLSNDTLNSTVPKLQSYKLTFR
ncbi:alpha-mannosidase 2-like [Uloborus diversus]|uniref:alpha-mannosidase 2-like n=1 Tax=Uloborus diversus TaxID=327109 RepID=UPI00240A5834|nr:alpha-mannosidase 2-like [Uloborus diversus]